MRKTILAFASILMMLAVGAIVVVDSEGTDAYDNIPAPEKAGVGGYPITVFKQDGSAQGYNSLDEVPVESGSEIWVYEDVSDCNTFTIANGEVITVHLHYSTIGFSPNKRFMISHGTLNVEGTGILTEKVGQFNYAPIVLKGSSDQENYSILNVSSGIELRGWAGVFITPNGSNNSGIVVNFAGKAVSGRDTSGDVGSAFYVNGIITEIDKDNPSQVTTPYIPKITILPGAILDGGDGNGIYAAGSADWNIEGAVITGGGSGIELRAGHLNIIDSTVTSYGVPTSTVPNGNGSTTTGAGIAVVQHTTKQPISVTVSSSTISAYTAFYQEDAQNNGEEATGRISLNIVSGTFNSILGGTVSVFSNDFTGFVNGGMFSTDIDQSYVESGKVLSEIGGLYCVATPVEVSSSGTIDSTTGSVIAEVGSTQQVQVNLPSATVSIAGDSSLNSIMVSAESKRFSEAPDAVASYEITIVASVSYVADITVAASIPYGQQAVVYYIDTMGQLIPVEVVSYTSDSVTFRTNHTTPFVIMTETSSFIPGNGGDDGDDYPFNIGQGSNQGAVTVTKDSSDDSTKIIAAAAAVVVIMLAAVALMVNRNN